MHMQWSQMIHSHPDPLRAQLQHQYALAITALQRQHQSALTVLQRQCVELAATAQAVGTPPVAPTALPAAATDPSLVIIKITTEDVLSMKLRQKEAWAVAGYFKITVGAMTIAILKQVLRDHWMAVRPVGDAIAVTVRLPTNFPAA